jgi:hypothetical protein
VSFAGRVPEAEVEAWARAHPDASPRERDAFRARRAEERVQAEVRSILGELRGRCEIRILAEPGKGR